MLDTCSRASPLLDLLFKFLLPISCRKRWASGHLYIRSQNLFLDWLERIYVGNLQTPSIPPVDNTSLGSAIPSLSRGSAQLSLTVPSTTSARDPT